MYNQKQTIAVTQYCTECTYILEWLYCMYGCAAPTNIVYYCNTVIYNLLLSFFILKINPMLHFISASGFWTSSKNGSTVYSL